MNRATLRRAVVLSALLGLGVLLVVATPGAAKEVVSDPAGDVRPNGTAPTPNQEPFKQYDITGLEVARGIAGVQEELFFTLHIRDLSQPRINLLGPDVAHWNIHFEDAQGTEYRFAVRTPLIYASHPHYNTEPDDTDAVLDFFVDGNNAAWNKDMHPFHLDAGAGTFRWSVGLEPQRNEEQDWDFEDVYLRNFSVVATGSGGISGIDRAPENGTVGSFGDPPTRVDMDVPRTLSSIRPDSKTYFEFTLENTGLTESEYTVETEVPFQWKATPDPGSPNLDPDETATVNLTVTAPNDIEPGDHKVEVSIVGPEGEELTNTTLTLVSIPGEDEFDIDARDIPVFGTGGTQVRVAAGQGAKTGVDLTNPSFANRSYDLSIDGPNDWVRLRSSSIELTAGASTEVELTVRPPLKAEPGWYNYTLTTAVEGADVTHDMRITVHVTPATVGSGATLPGFQLVAALAAAGAAALLTKRR